MTKMQESIFAQPQAAPKGVAPWMVQMKTGKLFRLSRQEGSTTEVLIKAIKWVRPYTNPNSLAIPSSA